MLSFQEYKNLITKINKYRQEVHLFGIENIDEESLDSLKHEISIFEQNNPNLISPDSPNLNIAGGILEGFEKFTHKRRMLSLVDIFDYQELLDWETRWKNYLTKQSNNQTTTVNLEDTEYYIEPKIDGLAVALHYKNGILTNGVTRGDSYTGEDVTENLKFVMGIPKTIPDNRYIEIRGEVFLTNQAFEKLNQDIIKGKTIGKMGKTGKEAIFANPRNAASGTLRQLDSNIVKQRNLSFLAYGCWIYENEN